MPKSQGKNLSYVSYAECMRSAKDQGVDASPCKKLLKTGPDPAMPGTQKPSASVKEEKSVTEKDTGAAYTRQFKRKGNTYAP